MAGLRRNHDFYGSFYEGRSSKSELMSPTVRSMSGLLAIDGLCSRVIVLTPPLT
jgi:hypothetical protein